MNWTMRALDRALGRRIPSAVFDGGGDGSQQSFQQQSSHSESSPNPFVQGMLKGITGHVYDLYTKMPYSNPMPDASANTRGYWSGAQSYGTTGMGGGAVNAARDNLAAGTLRGDYLNLQNNPYFQDSIKYAQQPVIDAFNDQVLPGIGSMFSGAGRTPQAGGASGKLVENAVDSLGRNLAGAATTAGNQAYQFERGQQGAMQSMLPQLQGMDLARLGFMGQAGQAQDAEGLQRNLAPMDFATRAGMSILGLYPGGVTDSSGYSSGMTFGGGGGGGFGSFLGAGMGLAGLGLQAYGLLSDRRDKTDIEELGVDPLTGLKTYAYRYKSDPKNTPKTVGPMAQDIEEVRPDLVREIGGHKVIAIPAGGLM